MKSMLFELLLTIAVVVSVSAFARAIGFVDWSWGAILMPAWLTAMGGIFLVAVIFVHEVFSTPEDRAKARERRHHRNWGL